MLIYPYPLNKWIEIFYISLTLDISKTMYLHNTGHNLQIMDPEFSNLFHYEKNNYLFIYFGLFTVKAQIVDTHKKT